MATPADSRAVKSLNNAKGRKRFVFKSSSQRINDTEIKVARKSLDKVKDHPSEGSTFFKDSLVELRELNTAADFISFYEEMLPFVQTLQLVKLQKELIFSKLVSGLHMKARLSLEAFLRLIAALSRDIEKDFMPFLPRLVNSLVTLLKNGGGQDEEIIEQIFLSLKAILNDLQKYLICDIEGFLRDTLELRYYSEYYITDKFVAPSVSFLLRTAQDEQLEIGIKMILSEVEDPLRKSGGVSLLYHVMRRGSSSSTVEVVSSTLQRICEDIKVEELTAMWNCLYQETKEAIIKKKSAHLSRLLTVLASAVRVEKGLKVYDCPCLFGLVREIVSTFMDSSDTVVLDKVFGLMLCTIDRPSAINEMESIASQWSPIFSLKGSSLLTFLRELLEKDVLIVKAFTSNILSWINNMILGSWEEVIPLLLSLCERQKTSNYIVDEPFESRFERIHEFLEENIKKVRMKIENTGLAQIDEAEFAVVWGSVNCYPYFKVDSSLLIYFKNTLKQHLAASVVNTFSAQELKWQSLLGATLRSCHKLCSSERLIHSDLEEALSLAKCYKSCVQVLSSVADYLDFVYKPLLANDDSSKACPEELKANSAEVAFDIFSENLRHSNKDVRLTTLRILCHFETLSPNSSSEEHPPKKKLKNQVIQKSFPERNVLQLLHTVEKSPITVSTQTELHTYCNSAFLGYNSENSTRVGLYNGEACKGEEWKKLLIQWLNLLKLMKNLNSSRLSLFVNDVLKNRFLDDNDAEIQTNVLQCLMLWNDYLLPHRSHLENLIKTEELREELVTWNLFKDIENAHRPHLVSLVIRILMPKVRNLKNSASRKHTSIRHRKAVLCFLSQFDVNELSLFFALLMKPFNIISEEAMDLFCSSGKTSLDSFHESNLLKYFTVDTILKLSRKQKSGFLHVIEHILEVFDEFHVRPFLDFLMGCVVRLLVNYAPNTDDKSNIDNSTNQEQAGSSLKQFKDLRSLCLKIIAHVLTKYEDCDLGSEFWDLFFSAMNPLIKSFKQEGSSSEKPSSLFSCFLSMITTASEDIKSYALKFIENLLILDHELEEHESMIKGFLDPYIEPLIISLHSLFIGDKSKRKSVKYKGERVIKILKLFSKHIVRDESCVTKYLDILLSFLDRSVKDSGIHREALLAIQDITPLLRTESTRKIINTISPLLVETKLDVRLCICDLLESLAKIDSSLVLVAKCVSDMNAIAPMEVDELDYDTIINAYEKIDAEFFNKFSEQHIMIILSQTSILCQEVSESNASWTGDRVLRIMNKFILKHIGDAVNRGKSSGKEEIRLIRKMVTTLPDCGNLAAFKPLCSENSEVDFFKNIFSIQSHRRAKAITGFAKVIKDNSLPEGVVRNILVSVFFKMLLDEQEVKNRNVQDACKEAIASVSAHMSWNSYYALLNRCFYEMKKHTNKRELLLQLIFLILNNFHFPKDEAMFLMIKKLMDSDTDSDRVKLNIYVAAVKALKLLPKEIMEPQLDSIVPKICSYLKSKDTHTRDEARKALASCLMELGLEYLQFFVKILLARLTRGSELHILGRTVNSILSKCLPSPTVGELDHCLEDLLAVAKTVIFGDFDERDEKRESRFSIKKETEKRKWLETLKLISENKHLNPKLKSKLEEMVKYIAAGIEANQSVDQEEFFCFVYDHVDDGINNKNLSGLEDKVSKKKRKSTETKCFTSLSRLKLPSLMSEADKVMSAVLTIIAQSPVMSSTSSLVQSCLNLLKALVFNEDFNLSSGKLKMLIQSPMFDDLESDSSVESSLSFIKAIVKKKVQDPKVYDIIADQVSKLMITTHEESIRKKCKEILLEFLVYYTLSKKRVEQHFSFLVNNLSYKHSIGRQAVFDVLQTLIGNFSKSDDLGKQSVLDQHCGNLFLQLSHCLATDDTKDVLTKIGDVIKLLVCSISKDKVDSSLEQCLVWYKLENSQAIAAKVLGLFIEARKEAFPKRIRDLLMQEAKTILETVVQLQDTIEEGIVPIFWKEAYYTLVMIEKLLKQFPHLCFGKDLEDIWKMVFKLLSHPHEWLRTISCRFLNHYFKALDGRKRKKLVVDSLLEKPSSLFMVASSLCSQLKERRTTGNEKDDANTEKIITANIVFAVSGLHTLIEQSDDHHEFWSSLDNDEQVVFLKAFEMLDSGKGRSTFLALTSGKRTANDVRNVLIGSLLKRMGKIALDTESLHMRIVFNVYKDFTSKLNKEECRLYAFRILFPLYKVCQGFTGKDISVELKQLAEEVRDSVRDECLGTQMFVQVYSEIKESLKRKREKRKLDVKEMAVINPERNAKRKLKLASKNKANKKRKIMRCKIDRWARS
ncbi:hypothetical protein AALP_AA1G237800 [Arabis alpina]|uniref:Uncharacterized protein n=1 Tax=Arabis alpina TaxID=50452 RepID=A0A087HQ79_ARAAL|nr:hypothetical protein AALP_AA1G237800 [Arabis alpina]